MWLEEAVQSCTDELIPAHLRMRRKRRMCLHRPSLTRNCIGDMVRHFPRNEHEGG